MLDYTKFLECKFRFILNYEVKDGNLIIHYAKEDDLVVPYTTDAEKVVLLFMKNQIIYSEEIFKKIRERYDGFYDILSRYLCGVGFAYSLLEQQFIAFIASIGLLGFNYLQSRQHKKIGIILEDYEKNKFFVDNQDKFEEFGVDININQLDSYTKEDLLLKLCYTEGGKTLNKE